MVNELQTNKGVLKRDFVVQTYNSSFFRTMKVADLFKFLQELASEHSDVLGIGFDDLKKHNGAWVLTKQLIDIERLPNSLETFTVYTWCSNVTKITAMRNFLVADKNGEVLARAKSEWVVIDLSSRRIIPISKINLPETTYLPTDFYNGKIEKIKSNDNETISTFDKRVRFTDIDINGHMNNTVYLDMVLDSMGDHFESYRKLACINSNFVREAKFGDEISIKSHEIAENEYYHTIYRVSDNSELFKAKTRFSS
jgi:acyl-ACP thioesterase